MTRFLVMLALLAMTTGADAAVAVGENLIINGNFDAEQTDFPAFWSRSPAAQTTYLRTGGPGGNRPAVMLHSAETASVSLRQQGLGLVAGETYRLSASVRTKGFHSPNAGVVVHNDGWITETGFKNLPADSDWTPMVREFTLFPSRGKEYGLAVFATHMRGELHVADIKLEAVSPGALAGSSSQMALATAPRLVPLEPLLHRIPASRPALTLGVFGNLPVEAAQAECLIGVDAGRPAQIRPLDGGRVTADLAGLAIGDYNLTATLRRKDTGATILQATFPISIIDLPTIDRTGHRPLNTLVTEVLAATVKADQAPQSFTFSNPRLGWVFIALNTPRTGTGPTATLDGQELPLQDVGTALEAFRELEPGEHRLTIGGNAAEAALVVRAIPEIFNYPPCTNSYVRENGSYGWDFMKEHVLPAVTTLNGGSLPGEALPEAKARGLKWLANFNVAPVDDPDGLRERLEKHAGMTDPRYDGCTSDELFFARTSIDHYTKALWTARNPNARLIYTWIVGKPAIPSLHTDFMSAAINASRGRGRLLFEAYCHPQPDQAAANAYLDNMVTETMRRFSAFLPNAVAGTGIIFGNFNQIPIISLEHNPAVDFKVFLDMQVNLIANRPEFQGLATTGYWGTYYGDEELVRWSFKLMRHYAVEGRKDMLSEQYGFGYNPGFVANPDFAEGLAGWTAEPAADDAIRTDTINGYGKNSQGRWGGGKAGDTVCIMARQADRPNRLTQTATGLEVGKAYCLQFVTADRKDLAAKTYNPRHYGIDAELEGAEVIPDRGYVHIDRRNQGRYETNTNVAKIALNRIVFRASAPTVKLTFTDARAEAGEELLLNFVQLKPYLE